MPKPIKKRLKDIRIEKENKKGIIKKLKNEKEIKHIIPKPIKTRLKDKVEDYRRVFYICSYGGSGSKMFCNYLRRFGRVRHIHSREPPYFLEYVGKPTYSEWFNGNRIEDKYIPYYTVIYIYRNPIKAILSRHRHKNEGRFVKGNLKHIQVKEEYLTITHKKFLESGEDLYGLEEFYDNYVNKKFNQNYNIYCIKYEDLWDNLSKINNILNIPDIPRKYPIKIEKNRTMRAEESIKLNQIYTPLIRKMKKMPFIYINKAN